MTAASTASSSSATTIAAILPIITSLVLVLLAGHLLTTVIILTIAVALTSLTSAAHLASTTLAITSTVVVSSRASTTIIIIAHVLLALTVLLHLGLIDRWLVANIISVASLLAEGNFKHSDNTGELEVIKTLLKRLVLINNGDVRDLVQLVKTLNTMLDQLGQLHCTLNSIGFSSCLCFCCIY